MERRQRTQTTPSSFWHTASLNLRKMTSKTLLLLCIVGLLAPLWSLPLPLSDGKICLQLFSCTCLFAILAVKYAVGSAHDKRGLFYSSFRGGKIIFGSTLCIDSLELTALERWFTLAESVIQAEKAHFVFRIVFVFY